MQIQVTKNKVILPDNYIINKGEYHVNLLEFLFSEEYTNEMVKKAIFVSKDESIEQVIINNQCHIPNEMLNIKNFELRVYAYEIENGELVLRYSPTYAMVYLREGSYKSDTSSEETITPTQFEQFEQALNNGLNELESGLEEVSNVDIGVSKSGNTATVTITKKDGTEKSVQISDGEKGDKGDDYVITQEDYQEIADIVENQINIPAKTSDLTNDSGFITKLVNNLSNYYLKSETYTKTEVNNLIGQIASIQFQLANELPLTGNSSYIYLVPSSNPTTQNIKDEYIWVNNAWEQIGSTQIDLTSYATENWVNSQISNFLTSTQIQNLINASLDGYVQDGNYVHTDNNYTTEEKTKLASLENYNDTQITELIENLEEENETLYNDHPDITETGTNIILNGTGDLKMKVDVGGNSTQVQYEGYNKLEGDTSFINTSIDSRTKLTLELWLSNSTVGSQDQKILKATTISSVGRYYYIFTPDSNTVGIVIKHNGVQTDLRKIFSIELQSGITYTISLDITGVTPSIKGGFSFDDVMIYEGTTEKPYEPYVGGTASPNPNYKQDISNVEGDVEVKGKNRQLFDKDNPNILKGYFTPSDTSFVANGGHRSIYIPCKSNTTYTVQKIATSRFRVGFTDILPAGGVEIINSMPRIPNGENLTEVTTTSGANSKYLIAWISNRNTTNEPDMNNILNSLQIVEGSTAKPYTAYAENTVTFPLSQGQKLMLGDTLEDDGIHHKRGQITFTGTTATLSDAKTNGAYLCDQKTSGNLSGQTLTFDSVVTNAVIEYELETETTEAYTSAQQTAYNKLKEMQSYYDLTYVAGTSDNIQPIITAHAKKSLKVMQDEIDNIESRLSVLE